MVGKNIKNLKSGGGGEGGRSGIVWGWKKPEILKVGKGKGVLAFNLPFSFLL